VFRKMSLFLSSIVCLSPSLAIAANVTFDAAPGQIVSFHCVDRKLVFSTPIPGLSRRDVTDGNAVAVILEAPDLQPEILVGKSERGTAGRQLVSEMSESKLPVTAFLQEKQLTIARLGESITVSPHGRRAAVASTVRECGCSPPAPPSASAVVSAPSDAIETAANLTLKGDLRWVVLASRPTAAEAFDVLQELLGSFRNARVLKSANGRFAIVAGPVHMQDADATKAALLRSKSAPRDLFFSQGQNFVARIEYRNGKSCRVHGTPDNDLNVRAEPGASVLTVIKEGERVRVSGTRMDERGQPWLSVTTQNNVAGWAFAKYIACD
jgi:hypothetical protein